MPRKIEAWLRDIFPGANERLLTDYSSLTLRELAVVSAAILDLALGELIALRLRDFPDETDSFLGADGDGRAPAASFGAKIQLALLLGLISPLDARTMRALKTVRNEFAHRVRAHLDSQPIRGALNRLLDAWVQVVTDSTSEPTVIAPEHAQRLRSTVEALRSGLKSNSDTARALLLMVLGSYQMYCHTLHKVVPRIANAWDPSVLKRE